MTRTAPFVAESSVEVGLAVGLPQRRPGPDAGKSPFAVVTLYDAVPLVLTWPDMTSVTACAPSGEANAWPPSSAVAVENLPPVTLEQAMSCGIEIRVTSPVPF